MAPSKFILNKSLGGGFQRAWGGGGGWREALGEVGLLETPQASLPGQFDGDCHAPKIKNKKLTTKIHAFMPN